MCFGGCGDANVSITVLVRRLLSPSLTCIIEAAVTPSWGWSSSTISSTLQSAMSRERITPLLVFSDLWGLTLTGTPVRGALQRVELLFLYFFFVGFLFYSQINFAVVTSPSINSKKQCVDYVCAINHQNATR